MINFTVYSADCVGNSGNCLYPNKNIVTDKESFIAATKMDHVTAKYKGNYRSKDNFESSDCIPLDCDNDHSENPEDWLTPFDIALSIPGVVFAASYSRHHNLPKGDKSARPRFHVFFPIPKVTDGEEYAAMKRKIADAFPYYDTNALDSARFLYGNDSDEVEFYEGDKTILDYLEEDDFADFDASLEQVPEGQRNSTMSHIAGKIIKRYGNTEEAYQIFLKKAELCNPPLPESELTVIWRSASKFGNKVSNQEGYIPPEQYNSDCRLKPEDFSDVGQATVLATEYKDILRYSPSTDYMVYNGSFWEESKPKSQGVSQDLTERQLAEAETEMKKAMDELVKNGGMEILVSVGPKKAVQMFNKQQAHAYEMYEDAVAYKKYAIKRRDTKNIAATLKEARPMLEVEQRNLDANEFMLNTPTLTYDLRQGTKFPMEHRPEHFITKQTTVDPSSDGADIWAAALDTFFLKDTDLIDYVQRMVGLSAIGRQIFGTASNSALTSIREALKAAPANSFSMANLNAVRFTGDRSLRYTAEEIDSIHCIWYCINTASNRIEPEEIEWLRELSMENQITQVPIVVVLTQSFSKKKAQEMRQTLLNENLDIIQVIPVLAEDYEIEDLGIAKSYGLEVLIKVMGEALPDELVDTLQHVQIACLEEKKRRAQAAVATAAVAAAGEGAAPIRMVTRPELTQAHA